VFDGVCALCSGWIEFVIRRDPGKRFKFAAMQTPGGAQLLAQHGIDACDPMTFLVLERGQAFTEMDAALRVVRQLGSVWATLAWSARLVPKSWRDAMYRSIAANRYRWFGRRAVCYVPRLNESERFIG
jgi:predicted DCC family thiol-disulfide oxidoreductase YuxK